MGRPSLAHCKRGKKSVYECMRKREFSDQPHYVCFLCTVKTFPIWNGWDLAFKPPSLTHTHSPLSIYYEPQRWKSQPIIISYMEPLNNSLSIIFGAGTLQRMRTDHEEKTRFIEEKKKGKGRSKRNAYYCFRCDKIIQNPIRLFLSSASI